MNPPILLSLLVLLLFASGARADRIFLTEVVTDPQADHSENRGGNGVPYDLEPGDGTISSVDEFVEIFNACATVVDLTGFTLEFLDTTISRFTFGSSSGVVRFSPGSGMESLVPGGFALVGNPPGALNNAITLRLLSPNGSEADIWTIPDGNATGADDESVFRVRTATGFLDETGRGAITPLALPALPEPVPEPATCLLVGVSLAAAARASARRARLGTRRTPPGARPARRPASSPR